MSSTGRLIGIASAALLWMTAARPAAADSAGASFCARLATESAQDCVPVDRGPQAAWDLAAAKWRPGPIVSLPVVALWAIPDHLDGLVHDKEAMVAFRRLVDVAMKFAEHQNAESSLASMRAQLEILERIRVRQAELSPPR